MRKIIFYQLENGKSPVIDFLESLSNKQVEKVFFLLDLIETIDIVPRKFLKSLNRLTFGKYGFGMRTIFFVYWVF
jgi:hypothetical protein